MRQVLPPPPHAGSPVSSSPRCCSPASPCPLPRAPGPTGSAGRAWPGPLHAQPLHHLLRARQHAAGHRHPKAVKHPKIDCFYVYPTVSDQTTRTANLAHRPGASARSRSTRPRASRRLPRLRARLPAGDAAGAARRTEITPQMATPTTDVRAAWRDYLSTTTTARLRPHRPLAGLVRPAALIAKEVDPKPAVRRPCSPRSCSAATSCQEGQGRRRRLQARAGLPLATQLGCVVAFSTFDDPAPAAASSAAPTPPARGAVHQPGALGGGSGTLDSIFPSAPFSPSTMAVGIKLLGLTLPTPPTTWVDYADAFTGRCSSANGGHVLQITAAPNGQTPKSRPTRRGACTSSTPIWRSATSSTSCAPRRRRFTGRRS